MIQKQHARKVIFLLSICAIFLFSPETLHAIDLNQASSAQLQALPGIGPKTARSIIEERNRGGAFTSLDDLSARVRGIGNKRQQALAEAGLRVKREKNEKTKQTMPQPEGAETSSQTKLKAKSQKFPTQK